MDSKYYTVEEAAELLRINKRTLLELIKSGKLRAYLMGRGWIIAESDLNELMESRSNERVRFTPRRKTKDDSISPDDQPSLQEAAQD